MPAEVETMAYVGEKPWHGLGSQVDGGMTLAAMLKAAGLNWRVDKTPLVATVEGVTEPLPVTDYFALVRSTDRCVLGVCGKDYVPTQNAQAFKFFGEFVTAGEMSMETAGSLQGGRQIWALANNMAKFSLPGDDVVRGYVLFSNPHIWGKSLVISHVNTRVVCSNTLRMALGESGERFRMPHIREFDTTMVAEAKRILGLSRKMLEQFEVQARAIAATPASVETQAKYVSYLFQPGLLVDAIGETAANYDPSNFDRAERNDFIKSMLNDKLKVDPTQFKITASRVFSLINSQPGAALPSANGTLWGSFNAVTYFADHKSGNKTRDAALTSAWFGTNSFVKKRALAAALVMARAA